jgi:hypothetical protein
MQTEFTSLTKVGQYALTQWLSLTLPAFHTPFCLYNNLVPAWTQVLQPITEDRQTYIHREGITKANKQTNMWGQMLICYIRTDKQIKISVPSNALNPNKITIVHHKNE